MSAVPYGGAKRAKVATRARKRVDRTQVSAAFFLCALFLGLTLMSYLASSLAGNVLVEVARREGIEAGRRATFARNQEALLRSRIERLQSLEAIDQWAMRHGMIAPDRMGPMASGGGVGARQP